MSDWFLFFFSIKYTAQFESQHQAAQSLLNEAHDGLHATACHQSLYRIAKRDPESLARGLGRCKESASILGSCAACLSSKNICKISLREAYSRGPFCGGDQSGQFLEISSSALIIFLHERGLKFYYLTFFA